MDERPARVLVVEDDHKTAELVALYLRHDGHHVWVEHDGKAGLDRMERERFDLLVLDVMLPGVDGLTLCGRAGPLGQGAVILLTARTREEERLQGFAEGADDYVTKPFSPRELVARARALLRRCPPTERDELRAGSITLDRSRHRTTVEDREVVLTATEFAVLEDLMLHAGHVRSRAQLLNALPEGGRHALERTVDVHVGNLRRKVQEGARRGVVIETVAGVGYRFRAPETTGDGP